MSYNKDFNYKNIIKQYGLKFLLIQYAFIIIALVLIRPKTWYGFGFIISIITVLFLWYARYKETKLFYVKSSDLKTFVKSFFVSVLIVLFYKYIGAYSLILAIIVMAGYKIWRSRKLFGDTVKWGISILDDIYDSRKNKRKSKQNN